MVIPDIGIGHLFVDGFQAVFIGGILKETPVAAPPFYVGRYIYFYEFLPFFLDCIL